MKITNKWWWHWHWRSVRLSFRYLTGSMSKDDAFSIIRDCEFVAGSFPLLSLDVSDVIERASAIYIMTPELEGFLQDGAEKVASNWQDFSDAQSQAWDEAIEKALNYAAASNYQIEEIQA
jgi:hypothetical protein